MKLNNLSTILLLLFLVNCDGELEDTNIFGDTTTTTSLNSSSNNQNNSIAKNSEKSINIDNLEISKTIPKTGQLSTYFKNDDGDKQLGLERDFVDKDGYILDKTMNLYWENSKSKKENWENSKIYCSNLTIKNLNNWRVPTKKELIFLTDKGEYNPAINPIFSKIRNLSYWSSDEVDSNSNNIWVIDFSTGEDKILSKTKLAYTICVKEVK